MAQPNTPTRGFLPNSQFPQELRRPLVSVAANGDRTITAPTGQKVVVEAIAPAPVPMLDYRV